jgi:hypothetical protein
LSKYNDHIRKNSVFNHNPDFNYPTKFKEELPYDFSKMYSFNYFTEGFNGKNAFKVDRYCIEPENFFVLFTREPTNYIYLYEESGKCIQSQNIPLFVYYGDSSLSQDGVYTLYDACILCKQNCDPNIISFSCKWFSETYGFVIVIYDWDLFTNAIKETGMFPFPQQIAMPYPYEVGVPLDNPIEGPARPINPSGPFISYYFPSFSFEGFCDYLHRNLVVGKIQQQYCSIISDCGLVIGTIGSEITVCIGPYIKFPLLVQYLYFIDLYNGRSFFFPLYGDIDLLYTYPTYNIHQPTVRNLGIIEDEYLLIQTDLIQRKLDIALTDVAGGYWIPNPPHDIYYPTPGESWKGDSVGGIYYPHKPESAQPRQSDIYTRYVGYPKELVVLEPYKTLGVRYKLIKFTDIFNALKDYDTASDPSVLLTLPPGDYVYLPQNPLSENNAKITTKFDSINYIYNDHVFCAYPYHIGIYKPGTTAPRLDSFYIPGLVPNQNYDISYRIVNLSLSKTITEISIDLSTLPPDVELTIPDLPTTLAPQEESIITLKVKYSPTSIKTNIHSNNFCVIMNYYVDYGYASCSDN